MNKKKVIKLQFANQIIEGFRFDFLNENNTIIKYYLKKNLFVFVLWKIIDMNF